VKRTLRIGPLHTRTVTAAIIAAVALVVILVIVQIRFVLMPALDEASIAKAELIAASDQLKSGGLGLTPSQLGRISGELKSSEAHFTHVHKVLTQTWWISAIGHLPGAGTQVDASVCLTDIGIRGARSAQELVSLATIALETPPKLSTEGGSVKSLLDAIKSADPKLRLVRDELTAALRDRERIPSKGLLPPLARAVAQLDRTVDLKSSLAILARFHEDQPGLVALLGGSGPRSYLVLQQDPAELRATGGFIGSVGFLSFNAGVMGPFDPKDINVFDKKADGSFVLGPRGSKTHVEPPAPLYDAFKLQSWELRDANWSPDFPTTARQARDLLAKESGIKVNGVIAIDPYFIQRLLAITGPLQIPEAKVTVDEKNFFAVTLDKIEVSGSNRKSFLSYAAREIIARVFKLSPSKWFSVLEALQSSCDVRSVQVQFDDPLTEKLIDGHQCGGEVKPPTTDTLTVIETNLGGDKDDFFMKRGHSLEIALQPDGSAVHTLKLHYYDLKPVRVELTNYVGYRGWLRVYLPPSAVVKSAVGLESATGQPKFEVVQDKDLGHEVVQGWFRVPFYKTVDVMITYTVPAAAMGADQQSLSLFWRKQAGRPADPIKVSVTLPSAWKLGPVQSPGGSVIGGVASSDLTVDRRFTFGFVRG
jgi:hypothetical protein